MRPCRFLGWCLNKWKAMMLNCLHSSSGTSKQFQRFWYSIGKLTSHLKAKEACAHKKAPKLQRQLKVKKLKVPIKQNMHRNYFKTSHTNKIYCTTNLTSRLYKFHLQINQIIIPNRVSYKWNGIQTVDLTIKLINGWFKWALILSKFSNKIYNKIILSTKTTQTTPKSNTFKMGRFQTDQISLRIQNEKLISTQTDHRA